MSEQVTIVPYSDEYFKENLDLMNLEIARSFNMARKKPIFRDELRNFLDFLQDQPNSVYLVAKVHAKVVGNIYVLPRMEDMLSHIGLISYQVHPDFQRKGIGSLLMENLLQKLRSKENEIDILYAEVLQGNTASVNFLKKYGFLQAGMIPDGVKIAPRKFDNLLLFYRKK